MKKKILALAAIAICASVAATGTLAYFTSSDEAHNVITSGGVDIELIEKTDPGNGAALAPFPEEGLSGIMPGGSASKIVSVRNMGESDAWVRVWVNTAISEPGDPITNPTIKCLPLEIDVNGEMVPVITYDINEKEWFVGEDGYYYYKNPVPMKKTWDDGTSSFAETVPLFEEVSFAKEMGNEYQNCKVMIDVFAEAIQSDNNPLEGEDYPGLWPEEY